MAHLKRQKVPKTWGIARKGTKYVVRPNFSLNFGVPVLVALRDMLKVVQIKKEAKKVIHEKKILLNGKEVVDEKNAVMLFDVVSIIPAKKHYRLVLSGNGKFIFEEVSEKDAGYKVAKLINKKILKGKKVQLNLSDGRNFLSDVKCKTNDSVLINFKDKKIEKCLELKEKAKVVVFAGKHAGEKGVIVKIYPERKMVKIKENDLEAQVLIKQMVVVE